ncbi:hypothetical protein BV511_07620 [Methylorubrum extorquens]|uniref:hypothetical protein n=1 Tax=Methylorubrum extorquens TaxID=408 RepID=UPI000972E972|nr:hypothetical protein [Methylorubrum extorquens]APX84590.1 hypothetical protein BV511_07620 [Methylorubrum extorquens]
MSPQHEDVSDVVDRLDRWAVARLWDANNDTVEIAKIMRRTEAEVYGILNRALDERRAARRKGGARA